MVSQHNWCVWQAYVLAAVVAVVFARGVAVAGPDSEPGEGAGSSTSYDVAVLSDDIEGLDVDFAEAIAAHLRDWGFGVTVLGCREVCESSLFNSDRFGCLVLPWSPGFPVEAGDELDAFVRSGGDLVLLGGHAFKEPVWRCGDQWHSTRDLTARLEAADWNVMTLFDGEDDSEWSLVSQADDTFSTAKRADGHAGSGLLLDCRLTKGKCMFTRALEKGAIPPGHDLLSFYARSGNFFAKMMCLELVEEDGSRWMAPVHVSTRWQRVCLAPSCFEHRGGGEDRGRRGDVPRFSQAVELAVGLESETTPLRPGVHTFWIDELASCGFKAATGVDMPNGFDVRCEIRFDGAFEDHEVYAMKKITRVRTFDQQDYFTTPVDIEGEFEGISAFACDFHQQSQFVPLLSALDRHGRVRGWAARLVVNYSGPFKGGHWAFFGITTPAFYRGAPVRALLRELVTAFRTGDLLKKAWHEEQTSLAHSIKLATHKPQGLRIKDEGTGFVYEDGRPFFIIGVNYLGPFGRRFFRQWAPELFEADFAKMQRFGINTVRIHAGSALYDDPVRLEALKECARRYGIYLVIVVADHAGVFPTKELIRKRAHDIAGLFKDEPMLLGYDLQNEPNDGALAGLKVDGGTLGELYPGHGRWWAYVEWAGHDWREDFFDFPWVKGKLPVPQDETLAKGLEQTDGLFRTWIGWYIDAIREVDKTHFTTIGHNTVYVCLDANERLDFISQHCYKRPINYENVVLNVTTMDRMKSVWPKKPISLGEFCCSGSWTAADRPIDVDTMSVYEMIHYLYPLAKGYAGAIKWQCNDIPTAYHHRHTAWIPAAIRMHNQGWRHGMFYDDGTPGGAPKPLAYGLRFLSKYLQRGLPRAEIGLKRSENLIGTGYVFRAADALFVGDVSFDGHGLRFKSDDGRPANVMLTWHGATLDVMATRDITVSLRPEVCLGVKGAGNYSVEGAHGGLKTDEDVLELLLLAGETVSVRLENPPSSGH